MRPHSQQSFVTEARRTLATPSRSPRRTFTPLPILAEPLDSMMPKLNDAKNKRQKVQKEYMEMMNRIAFLEEADRQASNRLEATKRLASAFETKRQEVVAQEAHRNELMEQKRMEQELKREFCEREKQRKEYVRESANKLRNDRISEVNEFKANMSNLKSAFQEAQKAELNCNRQLCLEIREENRRRNDQNKQQREKTLQVMRHEEKMAVTATTSSMANVQAEYQNINNESHRSIRNLHSSVIESKQSLIHQKREIVNSVNHSRVEREEGEARALLRQIEKMRQMEKQCRSKLDRTKDQQMQLNKEIMAHFSPSSSPSRAVSRRKKHRSTPSI